MPRRLCEAARRRQARVTASARLGRYFDDRTRRRVAGGPKPAGIRLHAHAPVRSPPRGAGRGRKSAGTVLFTALRSCGVSPHSTGKRGNEKAKRIESSNLGRFAPVTSRAGSTLPLAELKRSSWCGRLSGIFFITKGRIRDVALAFGVLWYLGYCEYPTIGRFGGPKTDPTKTWYPGPQTVPPTTLALGPPLKARARPRA
jgi:hypothetical protein